MIVKFVVHSRVVNTKYITRKEKMSMCLVAVPAVIFAPHKYMTTLQGMPKDIKSTMQKMINSFVWGSDRTQINLKQARESFQKGSIKLLDIQARNKAIDIICMAEEVP